MGNKSCCSQSSTLKTTFLIQCDASPQIRSPELIYYSINSLSQETRTISRETSFPNQSTQRLAKPLKSKNSEVEDVDSSVSSTMYPCRNGNSQTPENENSETTESTVVRRNSKAMAGGSTLQFQGIEGNLLQQWSETQQGGFEGDKGRKLNEEIHEIFRKLSADQRMVEHEGMYVTGNLKSRSGFDNSLFISSLKRKQLEDDGWSYGGRERMTQTGLTNTRDGVTRIENTGYYNVRNRMESPEYVEGSSSSFCEFENCD